LAQAILVQELSLIDLVQSSPPIYVGSSITNEIQAIRPVVLFFFECRGLPQHSSSPSQQQRWCCLGMANFCAGLYTVTRRAPL